MLMHKYNDIIKKTIKDLDKKDDIIPVKKRH